MKEVTLYTDGACSGNPGPGGWGAILVYGTREKSLSGGEEHTTNNRMELTAVIRGLEALKEPCSVEIVSDSSYVVRAIEEKWLASWMKNGWRNSQKKPVPNQDLWNLLLLQLDRHVTRFTWIKGHAGHPYNERCDKMAVEESRKFPATPTDLSALVKPQK